jgi:8-oxo-dGTP diphosphatase
MTTLMRVTAAIIVDRGRVLIAQRGPADRMAGFWEFPGGKIEIGETPEACLARELREELGITAAIGLPLGRSIHRDTHLTIELLAYQAFWDGRPFKPREHQACRWVLPGQLSAYDFTPADRPFVDRLMDEALVGELSARSRFATGR